MKHCEKVSFFTTFAFILAIFSAYFIYSGKWQYPVEYFYYIVLAFMSGWAGVAYYRVKNRKKLFSRETLFFWQAKP